MTIHAHVDKDTDLSLLVNPNAVNVAITGAAGTGKSFRLSQLIRWHNCLVALLGADAEPVLAPVVCRLDSDAPAHEVVRAIVSIISRGWGDYGGNLDGYYPTIVVERDTWEPEVVSALMAVVDAGARIVVAGQTLPEELIGVVQCVVTANSDFSVEVSDRSHIIYVPTENENVKRVDKGADINMWVSRPGYHVAITGATGAYRLGQFIRQWEHSAVLIGADSEPEQGTVVCRLGGDATAEEVVRAVIYAVSRRWGGYIPLIVIKRDIWEPEVVSALVAAMDRDADARVIVAGQNIPEELIAAVGIVVVANPDFSAEVRDKTRAVTD